MSSILELIKQSATDENAFKSLESIFNFYEQLQYATNIKQVAEDIFIWLNKDFDVNNLIFSLFDINKSIKEDILIKGKEFYLDDDLSHFFIVNTHTNLNATVSFCATSQEHSKFLEEKYQTIEAAFSQVSPIIQNNILKKNFIDSLSLDSVTNVYTRDYLIKMLSERIRLLESEQNEMYLLMIGIDRFKAIIDEFNYEIGDKVLIELARVIHSNISEFDMVGRLDADTFLVSLNDSNEIQACNIAKKIISDFSEIDILVDKRSGQTLKKTICVGLERYLPNYNISLDDSIKNADTALYEARNKGRGQFFKFSDLKSEDNIELF
ncbi:GGDEF domain-containing protein [Aliarcobacter butzleri]|jgi:diguanylate cyclase (GGDEF)-like protein|uniref:Diguanylate cyclase n=3 Tax=Aliarcobacter butzleri TaxID=28197 RepID=A0A837JBL9_9BACT|nr:GGDEF domain-containing protein [Aliarcobacter butzleri]AGR77592.1 diguanylate cyclase [Aliarcobacter butzleri 7h1h]KLE00676.1 diguanylate cyclase [Aliarcobacter butzleri L348]KLE05485.1 diguanylate cyclase [Aliarcobacter butzleri L352]MCG3653289.1 GGDEF domain-containing protein [Aliarcobacter butzleri]MCG3667450.1 GGDEF domain-containing protein [Aliarcobacter butzleri]